MSETGNQLKQAVHSILNDVVEQCFTHLIHHPQDSDELNRIIRDASDEMNYQIIKIDAHSHRNGSNELEQHYRAISKDLQRRSLELLSRLQEVKRASKINAVDRPPLDF
ncbi:MAG: hypothetical protein RL226_1083 [Bacteroidota bacterium]|jgi:uncharacterized protein YpuA (DUF1002 family)